MGWKGRTDATKEARWLNSVICNLMFVMPE